MSLSAAHTAAFRREVPGEGRVYTIRDGGGHPIPKDPDGRRTMPFWSTWSRARRVVAQAPAYREFEIVSIPVTEWIDRWLPSLERDGLLVGDQLVRCRSHRIRPRPGAGDRLVHRRRHRIPRRGWIP